MVAIASIVGMERMGVRIGARGSGSSVAAGRSVARSAGASRREALDDCEPGCVVSPQAKTTITKEGEVRFTFTVAAIVAAASAFAFTASTALADPPCVFKAQCGITSPATITDGVVARPGAYDANNPSGYDRWYRFWGKAGTQVTVTAFDDESVACIGLHPVLQSLAGCGSGNVQLILADQPGIDPSTYPYSPTPAYWGFTTNDGINWTNPPARLSSRLPLTGIYDVIVQGEPARDASGNPLPTPWTLTVTATPNVQWPAPPTRPSCVIPALRNVSLSTATHRLAINHCRTGRLFWQHSQTIRRNRVIANHAHWRQGTRLPNATKVALSVSLGR